MKRRITLSIALALSVVLLSLMSSDSTAKAQQPQRFVADTGVITLGPNQVLRLTILSGTPTANGSFSFRLRRFSYAQASCADGVCKLSVASQTTSDPMTLMPGESASVDIPNTAFGVRGMVESNSRNLRVNAIVFDTSTQRASSFSELEVVAF